MNGIFWEWFARLFTGLLVIVLGLCLLHMLLEYYERMSGAERATLCIAGFLLLAAAAALITWTAADMGAFAHH